MLKTLSGVTIRGGYFKEARSFKLFGKQDQRVAIIYGKNGSGKSSIAKAITEYKGKRQILPTYLYTLIHEIIVSNKGGYYYAKSKSQVYVGTTSGYL